MRILLIEDDIELDNAIEVYLKKEGYQTDICENRTDAMFYMEKYTHDVIVLDRMLPGRDGMSLLRDMRGQGIVTPVIMVTAMNGVNDRIDGLDGGADDYLVKPFAMNELMARIRALLRRPRNIENPLCLSYMDLNFDTATYVLSKDETELSLSKREGSLLEFLLLNKDTILTREQILNRVWGLNEFVEEGNLDNYIYFLRRLLYTIHLSIVYGQ